MSKVYLFGVGFDEKLVLRAVLKVGVKPGDTVLLVYSTTTTGEFEKVKVENAMKNLRKILGDAGVNVIELQIRADSFPDDVSTVVKELGKRQPEVVTVSLGSGMRYVAFILLYSCLLYKDLFNKEAKIIAHAAREDGLYDVTVELSTVKVSLGQRELGALCIIYQHNKEFEKSSIPRDELVKKLSSWFYTKLITAYKLINRMEHHGLIVVRDNRVELTPLGKSITIVKCREQGG